MKRFYVKRMKFKEIQDACDISNNVLPTGGAMVVVANDFSPNADSPNCDTTHIIIALSQDVDGETLCYLQVLIVTLQTFNCEQELNSNCSRRILAQHIRCCRHALLSNARLTFNPRSS
jgi:hypothetical protein